MIYKFSNTKKMKKFLFNITKTYKALKILSNPELTAYIQNEFRKKAHYNPENANMLGKQSAYFHKHYVVQVFG